MKKPAPLTTVIEVATLRRDQALQALGRARQEMQSAELQLSQLEQYTQESLQRWSQRAAQGISPMLLRTHQNFMAKIDHAVQFQHGVMQRLQNDIERCQQQVFEAERQLASLNKYTERRESRWQQQLQRQEQKSNDEMASTLHRQRQAAMPWRHP